MCLAAGVVLAQAPPTQFEVATIKRLPPLPASTPLPTINLAAYYNGNVTMNNVTLSEALRFAGAVSGCAVSNIQFRRPISTLDVDRASITPTVKKEKQP